MSNRRRLKQGKRGQRVKHTWSGRLGNPTTRAQVQANEAAAHKPRFILQPKGR